MYTPELFLQLLTYQTLPTDEFCRFLHQLSRQEYHQDNVVTQDKSLIRKEPSDPDKL